MNKEEVQWSCSGYNILGNSIGPSYLIKDETPKEALEQYRRVSLHSNKEDYFWYLDESYVMEVVIETSMFNQKNKKKEKHVLLP